MPGELRPISRQMRAISKIDHPLPAHESLRLTDFALLSDLTCHYFYAKFFYGCNARPGL
jgi:hypothetical protein